MSITWLKTLIAIGETGSFTAAAERVHVTPAAVGQQMRQLEARLGIALFDRNGRYPILSATGHAFLAKARDTVESYEALINETAKDAAISGELVLGSVHSAIRHLVPLALKRMRAAYPELHVRVVPGPSYDLQEQIERGAIDAAVTSEPTGNNALLTFRHFATERLVLIASPDEISRDPLHLLATEPYIRHTRKATVGMLAERWLAKKRLKVRAAMEMESLETLATMVQHGLGVSIVPDICVPDPAFASLTRLPLGEDAGGRDLGMLARTAGPKGQLIDALCNEIRTVITADINGANRDLR